MNVPTPRRRRSVSSPDRGFEDTIDGQAAALLDVRVRECMWPPLRLDRLRLPSADP
jgi:hypothetical protein